MEGVTAEGYGQRVGERLRVEKRTRGGYRGIALCGGYISVSCGFTDRGHFTRMFNRIVGVSPGAWCRAPALKE
ncbi:YesN/AraC family two-component response regulator [Bradyrhizobium sp. F1.2.2]